MDWQGPSTPTGVVWDCSGVGKEDKGPDGIGDYRARLSDFTRSVGVGPLSPEATGDLAYLYRAAPHMPAPLPKQCYAGGVGWAVHYGSALNSSTLLSNKQIK
ncbi:hypothetical protein NFI96_000114, partial [Prochilodus magdalenae]